MGTKKQIELFGMLAFGVVTGAIVVAIHADYLSAVFLYFGLPSLYLTMRKPTLAKKSAVYSLLFGIPSVMVFDYIAHVSKTWFEASSTGIRILNSYPIDAFVWVFLLGYFIVIFYEYFFDRDKNKEVFSPKVRHFVFIVLSLLSLFGIVYFFNKELLIIKYFYALVVVFLIILPTSIILYHHPHLFNKIALEGVYFFILTLIYELTAVYLNLWYFPGKYYIGFVELFRIQFPFEEFLWLVLAVPAYLCIYEYFADDRK